MKQFQINCINSFFKNLGDRYTVFFDQNEYDEYVNQTCELVYINSDPDDLLCIRHLESLSECLESGCAFIVEDRDVGKIFEVQLLSDGSFFFDNTTHHVDGQLAA